MTPRCSYVEKACVNRYSLNILFNSTSLIITSVFANSGKIKIHSTVEKGVYTNG